MSFRRRIGMSGGELTLSSYSSTVSAAAGSIEITVYWNETKINFSECTYTTSGNISSIASTTDGKCKINYAKIQVQVVRSQDL